MKNIETKKTVEIQYQECDFKGEYRLVNLLSSLADLAVKNATDIQIWKKEMEQHYGWVLSKQTIKMKRPICLGEVIQFSTRAKKASRVQFTRTYDIFQGEQMIGGVFSLWTLLDLQKRKIIRPEQAGVILPEIEEYECLVDQYEKIRKDIEMTHLTKREVLYSDVDVNQHMNNSRYIEWAMDLLSPKQHQDFFISELSMYYKKELPPHASVDLFYGEDQNYFKIEFKNNDELCFELGGLLEKR